MALSRAQKKLLAFERAQRRLERRLDDIDWEIDYLTPKVEELKEIETKQNVTIELETGDAAEDQD